VHLPLNHDVNIIVGENGSGKSTLLMILKMISGLPVDTNQKNFKSKRMKITWVSGTLGKQDAFGSIKKDIPKFSLKPNRSNIWEANSKKNVDILVNYIATFDSSIYRQNDYDEINYPFIETHLDKELFEQLKRYTEYQNRLLKKSENRGKSLNAILKKRDWLFHKLNELFEPTNKRFVESEEDTQPKVILSNNEKLSLFQLSSGEKQLLLILLTVLCQDEKPTILLLDEPEISLHTDWQYELIDIIRSLNRYCQVIAVTHSPSMFNDGWRNKVIWMADVIKDPNSISKPTNADKG
jgi:ABC-type lipoprotein export system ATPase subunit